jgi:glycosyltransferase involved in cell wall biosynthesis
MTFGCYGSPGLLKNVAAALNAFLIFHKELPNSRLLVYGSGWEGKTRQYVHLPIEFRGAQPHSVFLSELCSQIDIWVHPSRSEANPISICEAIQAGCPVIAGCASGGVSWTLDYGQAGILLDIENPSEIAQAMLGLVHNRERALDLVAYGRQMIRDRFSLDRVVQMHLDYYQEIVNQAVR